MFITKLVGVCTYVRRQKLKRSRGVHERVTNGSQALCKAPSRKGHRSRDRKTSAFGGPSVREKSNDRPGESKRCIAIFADASNVLAWLEQRWTLAPDCLSTSLEAFPADDRETRGRPFFRIATRYRERRGLSVHIDRITLHLLLVGGFIQGGEVALSTVSHGGCYEIEELCVVCVGGGNGGHWRRETEIWQNICLLLTKFRSF